MLKKIVLGQVRHLLTTFGGAVVTAGVYTDQEWTVIAGAIPVVIGGLWSYFEKRKQS